MELSLPLIMMALGTRRKEEIGEEGGRGREEEGGRRRRTVDWSGAQFAAADAKRKSYVAAGQIRGGFCSHEASVTTSSRQCAHIAMYHAILLPEYKGCFSSAYLI